MEDTMDGLEGIEATGQPNSGTTVVQVSFSLSPFKTVAISIHVKKYCIEGTNSIAGQQHRSTSHSGPDDNLVHICWQS